MREFEASCRKQSAVLKHSYSVGQCTPPCCSRRIPSRSSRRAPPSSASGAADGCLSRFSCSSVTLGAPAGPGLSPGPAISSSGTTHPLMFNVTVNASMTDDKTAFGLTISLEILLCHFLCVQWCKSHGTHSKMSS